MRPHRLLLLVPTCLMAAPAAADHGTALAGDAMRGEALAAACAGCHGARGRSVIEGVPSLAGQRYGYLVAQLQNMRWSARKRGRRFAGREQQRRDREERFPHLLTRRRSAPAMDPYVVGLSDQDIRDLAAYYGGLDCRWAPTEVPPRPPVAARCVICHGDGGVSDNHMVPTLTGQDAAYLQNQLLAFRSAGRQAKASGSRRSGGMMTNAAAGLSDAQIVALSKYFAALPCAAPVQPSPTAEPTGSRPRG